jgi:hypothetical protein
MVGYSEIAAHGNQARFDVVLGDIVNFAGIDDGCAANAGFD